jgi:hypothetical protein
MVCRSPSYSNGSLLNPRAYERREKMLDAKDPPPAPIAQIRGDLGHPGEMRGELLAPGAIALNGVKGALVIRLHNSSNSSLSIC